MFDADAVKKVNADAVFLAVRLAVFDAATNEDTVADSIAHAVELYTPHAVDSHAVYSADAVQEIMRLTREYRTAINAVFHRENAYGKGAE